MAALLTLMAVASLEPTLVARVEAVERRMDKIELVVEKQTSNIDTIAGTVEAVADRLNRLHAKVQQVGERPEIERGPADESVAATSSSPAQAQKPPGPGQAASKPPVPPDPAVQPTLAATPAQTDPKPETSTAKVEPKSVVVQPAGCPDCGDPTYWSGPSTGGYQYDKDGARIISVNGVPVTRPVYQPSYQQPAATQRRRVLFGRWRSR